MPMSLEEEIRLLSMVDILGPLSEEDMEDLAKRAPDTFLEQDDILYTSKEGTERLFILKTVLAAFAAATVVGVAFWCLAGGCRQGPFHERTS
jgi:hypothetical protein